MEKTKRTFSFLLIILMILMSSACNNISDERNSDILETVDAPMRYDTLPEKLKNPEIRFFLWSEPNEDYLAIFNEFERRYGGKVRYELTTWGELESKVLAAIASGNAPDIHYVYQSDFVKRVTKNVLMPIDDYIDLDDFIWKKDLSKQFEWNGKNYCPVQGVSADFIFYNKTMFENYGVKTPMEYYEAGQWNFDNFKKVAVELTDDIDKDGNTDQWGYASWKYELFVLANGGNFVEKTKDGRLNLTVDSPETLDALQFIQDGYHKYKYIMPDGTNKWNEDFPAGKIAMIGESAYVAEWFLKGKMKDEWDIAPFPAGPGNPEGISPSNAGGWTLVNGTNNPVGAAAYLIIAAHYSHMKEKEMLLKYFNEKQAEMILEKNKRGFLTFHYGVGAMGSLQYSLWHEVFTGEAVATAVEKYKPQFQREIDMALK